MTPNDQYALTVLRQWMTATARWNHLQESCLSRYLELALADKPATYDEYLDQCIAEQDLLQIKIDRWWALLEAWQRGDDILVARLALND